MEEHNAALVELTRKQRSDRHFLLSRLESAFSKIGGLERRQKVLEEDVQDLKGKLQEEADAAQALKQAHAKEIEQLHSQLQQVEARMSKFESIMAGQHPSAFSQAAQKPSMQEDPYDVDYLAAPAPLATESSFAFGLPQIQPSHQNNDTPQLQPEPVTTWDLLNLGDDLPQMADTIRQSFFDKQQAQATSSPRSWQGRANHIMDTSQSEPCATTEESLTDSDTVTHPEGADHRSQTNASRVMSTSSLHTEPELNPNRIDYASRPDRPRVTSTSSLHVLDPGVVVHHGYPVEGPVIAQSYPDIGAPEISAPPLPPESCKYPSVFEPLGSSQAASATATAPDPLRRYTTLYSAQLQRRDASLKSQKLRFEQMCELESRNVEQEIVRPNVFEALSKAGEMLKTAEQLMRDADAADQEAGRLSHEDPTDSQQDRSDAQRGADIRANKIRNALETSYSRLCSALDYATQRQNILVHEQKTQRSSSAAMKNLKALLGRKEPEPEQEDRDSLARPGLGRSSASGVRPVTDPSYTSPLLSAVDRMRKETTYSPQRAARPPANKAPTHRRALSDNMQFPPTPDLKRDSPSEDHSRTERSGSSKNLAGHKSDTELMAIINELEQRRLALYI